MSSERSHVPRRRRADLLAMLFLVLASMIFVADQVDEHKGISPIDEYVYIDYFAKVLDHGVVHQGEHTGVFTRRYFACDGMRLLDVPPDPTACKAPHAEGGNYPLAGGTTADLYPPVYFGISRVLAQPFVWAGADLVSAGRLTGMYWLAAAALVLYIALRRLRIPLPVAAGVCLLLVGSLPAYWSTTYISTDAPALLAGSVAFLLATATRERHRWAMVLLPLASAVASLTKVQNLVGFVAAAVFLLLTSLGDPGNASTPRNVLRRVFDTRVLVGAGAVVAGVVAQGSWLALRTQLAVGPAPHHDEGQTFHVSLLWKEASGFLLNLTSGSAPLEATGSTTWLVLMITTLVTLGGIIGLAVGKGVPWEQRTIAFGTIGTAVLAGPMLALSVVATEGKFVDLPTRYGMSLIPWALASFALMADTRSRTARIALLVLGVATWALSLTFFDYE